MDSLLLHRNKSRNTLLRLVAFSLLVAGLIYLNLDFLRDVYFHNQLTNAGYIINSVILLLFFIGLFRIIIVLFSYMGEEKALEGFVLNLNSKGLDSPLHKVPLNSLIGHRYQLMRKMFENHAPINHSALAATLVASESSRGSTPRYINNILILTGVFGTIASLSLALLGASDLLENSVNVGGMGIVIHGMSTALNTTITAIVCYVFFGYFNMKLADVQTNLISGIEQVTGHYLMPKFQIKTESVLYEFTGLIRSLQVLVDQMQDNQEGLAKMEEKMLGQLEHQDLFPGQVLKEMSQVKQILVEGFRLAEQSRP
jgi:hypothetical protein